MSVGLQEHLQRVSHVNEADALRSVEDVDAHCLAGALLQQRAGRNVLGSAGGVIADLLCGMTERPRAARQKVSGYDLVIERGRRSKRQSLGNNSSKANLPRVGVVPKQVQRCCIN